MIDLTLKYDRNNIPILSNNDIEDVVEAICRDFSPSLLCEPQAIDVEELSEGYINLHTDYANLSHRDFIWGMTVFENTIILAYDKERREIYEVPTKANTIVIDSSLLSDREHALRSTFGHEIGHYMFHSAYYLRNTSQYRLPLDNDATRGFVLCGKKQVAGDGNGPKKLKTDKDWLEHQAKYFSAAILMPKTAMKIVLSDLENLPDGIIATEVSRIFNVSIESAKYRIKDLRRIHSIPRSSQNSSQLKFL